MTENLSAPASADLLAGPADPVDATSRPARRRTKFGTAQYLLILLLGALAGLGPLAIDMYLPSFPAIAADFGTSVAAVERTLGAYFIGLALGQLFYGPAADRFGRKAPLYVGLVVFALASIGCALTRSVEALIALRFLQALGGCAEMVVARAIVRDLFDVEDAARVFSSLMLVMGLAPILAPIAGGWVVLHLGWRALFWTLAGFAVLCFAASALFLKESLPVERRRRDSPAATLRVYLGLLRDRTFVVHAACGSLMSAGLFAYVGGSPFVFMELFHVPAERFGLFFGANALGLILSAQLNGVLAGRVHPSRTLRVVLIVAAAAGALLLLSAATGWGGFPGILVPLFVFVCCLGLVFPTTTALAMAPHGAIAGNASAVFGCLQFGVSGIGGVIVSLIHDDTARPMAGVIALCAGSALLVHLLFAPAIPTSREGGADGAAAHG